MVGFYVMVGRASADDDDDDDGACVTQAVLV